MCYTKFATHLLIIFVVWCFFAGVTEATILRVDYCGAQFTPTQPVPIYKAIPFGRPTNRTMRVRGDLVNLTTRIDVPPGISVVIVNRTDRGGLNTTVDLEFNMDQSTTVGIHDIKLRYAIELSGPDVFKIKVLSIPTIDTIIVSPIRVAKGTNVEITAKGTGLTNVRLKQSLYSKFGSGTFQDALVANSTTYTFFGRAEADLTLDHSSFHDSALTDLGIAESYSGGLCKEISGSGRLSYTLQKPDLVAGKAARIYRLGPAENCNGQLVRTTQPSFCTELAGALPAPTPENPHIEQLRNLGGIIYLVTNPTPFPITGSFKVQLKNGINLLKEDIVNGIAANGHKILSYSRPENRRMLMRDFNCPSCYDLNVAPYNWVDPQYTVVVDVDNQIDEQNENNNTALSD